MILWTQPLAYAKSRVRRAKRPKQQQARSDDRAWKVVGENARGFVPSGNPGITLLKNGPEMNPKTLEVPKVSSGT